MLEIHISDHNLLATILMCAHNFILFRNTITLMLIEFVCMHNNVSGSHSVADTLPSVGRVGVPRMQNEMKSFRNPWLWRDYYGFKEGVIETDTEMMV